MQPDLLLFEQKQQETWVQASKLHLRPALPQSFWNNAISTFAANDETETPTETPKSQTPKRLLLSSATTQGSNVTAAQVLGYQEARGRVEAKLNLKWEDGSSSFENVSNLSIVHKHRKASEPQRVGVSRGLHHNDHCGIDATGKIEGLGSLANHGCQRHFSTVMAYLCSAWCVTVMLFFSLSRVVL